MTHFSEEQIAEFQEAFSLFDKDADGYISKEELGVVILALGVALTESDLQLVVQDAGETVDFPEFLTLMVRTLSTLQTEERQQDDSDAMLEALTLLDKDNSGVISTSVLRHVLTTLGEAMTSEEVEELLQEADKEGTGQVDYRELIKMMTS